MTNIPQGFLIIECYKPDPRYFNDKDKELWLKYKGFDGNSWPDDFEHKLHDVFGITDDFEWLAKYYSEIRDISDCKFLYVKFDEDLPINIEKNFEYCGFDFGMCTPYECEFSILFQEIICGNYDELTKYNSKLNEHLLLSDPDIVKDILKTREQLVQNGADLEAFFEEDHLEIYEIYSYVG